MKKCSIEGCTNRSNTKGYCVTHHRMLKLDGVIHRTNRDPNEMIHITPYYEIHLYSSKGVTIGKTYIDEVDYLTIKEHKWYLGQRGYATTRINNKLVLLHQLLVGKQIDHKDRDPLNNRRSNLRVCTQKQNTHNSGPTKNSSSRYKGVSRIRNSEKWEARIKDIHLGRFSSEKEAAIVYNIAAIEHFGDYAYLNPI